MKREKGKSENAFLFYKSQSNFRNMGKSWEYQTEVFLPAQTPNPAWFPSQYVEPEN